EGYPERDVDGHAGLVDTALMLAIDPRLVRTDRFPAAVAPGSGATGDPGRARAELGRPGVEAVVARTVDAIREATRHARAADWSGAGGAGRFPSPGARSRPGPGALRHRRGPDRNGPGHASGRRPSQPLQRDGYGEARPRRRGRAGPGLRAQSPLQRR